MGLVGKEMGKEGSKLTQSQIVSQVQGVDDVDLQSGLEAGGSHRDSD